MTKLVPGDRAPEFSLPDDRGQRVSLGELRARGPVVLYFYPKDHTLGCTVEACTFRDRFESFEGLDATVVGVSEDGETSHREFRSKHGLPFVLLSDPGGAVAHAYGVKKVLGLLPGRVTFVIDREGIVRGSFESALRVREHVERALGLVQGLPR